MKQYSLDKLDLNTEEIFRAIGSGTSQSTSQIIKVIENMRAKALRLMEGRFVYDYVTVNIKNSQEIILANELHVQCNPRFFKGATHALAAVGTTGSGLEQESGRLFNNGNYLEGLVLDAYGTAALDVILGTIRDLAQNDPAWTDYKLGYSLSPGCRAIPISEQLPLFALLDPEQIGVSLHEGFLMVPVKSLSVLIPMGKELELTSSSTYSCTVCNLQHNCVYRQT